MHCLTASGQWAMQLPQCTATLPWGSGRWNSCNALPHCPGAVGTAAPAMLCLTAGGQRAVQFLQRRPQCPWAAGIGSPAMPCYTAWRKVVELLQCTASEPGGSRQWNSCNAPPHYLGAVCRGMPAMQCLTTWWQWAVQLLQSTSSLPGGSGWCNTTKAWYRCLGPVGGGTPAMHRLTA